MRFLILVPLLAVLALACSNDSPDAAQGAGRAASPPQDRLPLIEGTVVSTSKLNSAAVRVRPNPDPPRGTAILEDVRVGSHPDGPGWDRIVFEFRNALPQVDIEVATPNFTQCGSGMPVTLKGSSAIKVRFEGAQSHDDSGKLTIDAMQVAGPGKSITESRQTCDFEGQVQWGIGLSGSQVFQVTSLASPPRLVIDVRH